MIPFPGNTSVSSRDAPDRQQVPSLFSQPELPEMTHISDAEAEAGPAPDGKTPLSLRLAFERKMFPLLYIKTYVHHNKWLVSVLVTSQARSHLCFLNINLEIIALTPVGKAVGVSWEITQRLCWSGERLVVHEDLVNEKRKGGRSSPHMSIIPQQTLHSLSICTVKHIMRLTVNKSSQ